MTLDQIVVTIGGLATVGFIYWFFLRRPQAVAVSAEDGSITIIVQGGYLPEVIQIPLGKPATLNFVRTDPTSCLEEVVFGDFNVKKTLPLNQKVSIQITPAKAGEFTYSCGMNMYHGTIIVR